MPVFASEHKSTGWKLATGRHTTLTAIDTVSTGLRVAEGVVVSLETDPADDTCFVSAVPGANGAVSIKTWKNTGGTDPTPAAATTFGKVIAWQAWGY